MCLSWSCLLCPSPSHSAQSRIHFLLESALLQEVSCQHCSLLLSMRLQFIHPASPCTVSQDSSGSCIFLLYFDKSQNLSIFAVYFSKTSFVLLVSLSMFSFLLIMYCWSFPTGSNNRSSVLLQWTSLYLVAIDCNIQAECLLCGMLGIGSDSNLGLFSEFLIFAYT